MVIAVVITEIHRGQQQLSWSVLRRISLQAAAHLLVLGGQLRSIGQALQGAATAALREVPAGRLHRVPVLAQRLQLARDGKALLDRRDAGAQPLARQRALAEDRKAPRQLAYALQHALLFDRQRRCP